MSWAVSCDSGTSEGSALTVDKKIIQGDTWNVQVILSDYYPDMEVRGRIATDYLPDGTTIVDFTAQSDDNLEWFLTADTDSLDVNGNYKYDIQLSSLSANIVSTFIRGEVTVIGQVTS